MTDDPRLDDSGHDPFERTPVTSPDSRRAPVSTSEQDSASAPASRKCESCGRLIAAGTLCAGCEQAFQRELTSDDAPIDLQAISTSQLDELFAAIEEAQARPKPPAEPAVPAVADAMAPVTAYAQTHTPVPMAEPIPEPLIATLPPITMPKPEPFVLPQDVAEPEPEYKPIALKPQPATVAPAIQPGVVMPEPAAASQPAMAVPLAVHATPEPAAAPEPTAAPDAVTVTAPAAAAPLEAAPAPASPFADRKPAASFMPRAAGRLKRLATVAAAVVAVAAIGLPLTKLWLGRQQTIVAQKPQPPAKPAPRTTAPAAAPAVKPAVDRAAAPASAVAPKAAPATAAPSAPAPASSRVTVPAAARVTSPAPAATAAARPKPATIPAAAPPRAAVNLPAASASRPTAKPVRPLKPALPAIAPAPVVESGPVALFEATEVAPVPPPAPAAPEAPIGPFYESTDVDKTPQVLSRVEPELSAELMTRARGEIVVVRFLVTQTGRPVLVSLLRRSKAGMDLDEAVIASIKNWTFAPAIKRGRAVSCFVHLGVPIGR